MTKLNTKRIFISGIVAWIAGTVLIWLSCGWLFGWVYKIAPTTLWKTSAEMMTAGNMIGSNVVGIVAGVLFALVFAFLYKGIPYRGVKKGLVFGFLMWLVGVLVGMASMPFYMNIATTVVVYWIIQALVIMLVKGAIVGAIYKR